MIDARTHVALISAYPTQTDARTRIPTISDLPYAGIWTLPLPYGGTVHVFTTTTAEDLEAHGWTREDAP